MASSVYESHDACPECGSRVIARKKDTPNGRPRVYPEPYMCRSCNSHFEDPDVIDVLVIDGE